MSAAVDWSHGLLAEAERKVLRRLAIFVGGFTLEAAAAVTADAMLPESEIVDLVAVLVEKSLVSADVGDAEPRLRLLETTRSYALARLAESGESDMLGRRHAEHYRDALEAAHKYRNSLDWAISFRPEIDNIRAALTWAFSRCGDESIGVALAAHSASIWLETSFLTECLSWTGKALANLGAVARNAGQEMLLQAAFGISYIFTKGMTDEARAALTTAADLAERQEDFDYLLRALHGLWVYHFGIGNHQAGLAIAGRCQAFAASAIGGVASSTADRMFGSSLHLLGDQLGARTHLECALSGCMPGSRRAGIVRFGIDQQTFALCMLANVLWVQGLPDQAARAGDSSLDLARGLEHPVSLCMALKWGGGILSLKTGDLRGAERNIAELLERAEKHSLDSDYACGLGLQGELAVRRGDVATGVQLIRAALEGLRRTRFEAHCSALLSSLASALAATGNVTDGLAAIDAALTRIESVGELWFMPEALRLKGALLLMRNDSVDAESYFLRSLDWARRQRALSWELRTSMSLARLQRDHGRLGEARDGLASVYSRFTEGFGTADLQQAKNLLDEVARGRGGLDH